MISLPMFTCHLSLLSLMLFGIVSAIACSSSQEAGNSLPAVKMDASEKEEEAAPITAAPDASVSRYAELRAQGKSHKAATELVEIYKGRAAGQGMPVESQNTLDAAVLLAKFSSEDANESARREQAASELRMEFKARNLSVDRALSLLEEITPEATNTEHRRVAANLAGLSGAGNWNHASAADTMDELIQLIAGDTMDAEIRISAAKELARRSDSGELDTAGTMTLVSEIAPELSADARRDAVVDIAGDTIKRFDSGDYDAEDVDAASELIKRSLSGDLDTEGVSDLLKMDR